MGKSILKSRTFWVNALTLSVATAGFISGHEIIAANPQIVAGMGVLVGIMNIALRFITTEPIK